MGKTAAHGAGSGLEAIVDYKKELRALKWSRYIPFNAKTRKKLEERHQLKVILEDDWKILYRDLADYTLSKLHKDAVASIQDIGESTADTKRDEVKKRLKSIREALKQDPLAFEMYEIKIEENSLHAFDADNGGLYKVIIKIPQITDNQNEFVYFVKRYSNQETYKTAMRNQSNVQRFSKHASKRIERIIGLEEIIISSFGINNNYRLAAEEYIGEGITLQRKIRDLQQKKKTISENLEIEETAEDSEKEKQKIRAEIIALYKDAISADIGLNQELIAAEIERISRLTALNEKKPYDLLYEQFSKEKDESRFYRRSLERLDTKWRNKFTADEINGLEQLINSICEPVNAMARILIHGDLHAKNIVYDSDGKQILIDPERYCVSNIFYDIARLTMHSDLSTKEIDELVEHGVQEYNQLIKNNTAVFIGYNEITFDQGKDIFQRITAIESLQMLSMMHRKSKVAKKKSEREAAAAYAGECYAKAYRIIKKLEIRNSSLSGLPDSENLAKQDPLRQLSNVYGRLTNAKIVAVNEIEKKDFELDASLEGRIAPAEEQGLASVLGRTAVADLNQSRGLLARIGERKYIIGRKFRMPAAIAVSLAILGLGVYSGYKKIEDYLHQKEVAEFRDKVMSERRQQIWQRTDPVFYGEYAARNIFNYQKEVEEMTKVRRELIYGSAEESNGVFYKRPYNKRYNEMLGHPLGLTLPEFRWKSYVTSVEYYAKNFAIDANLIRAVIAASDWINKNGLYPKQLRTINGSYEYTCLQPIVTSELKYLGITNYQEDCLHDEKSIRTNILNATLRLKEKLEIHQQDTAKALLDFYDEYFKGRESTQYKTYPTECIAGNYWDMRFFDQQQIEKSEREKEYAYNCSLSYGESIDATDFVEIALVFYERFQKEFGTGKLWEDGAIREVLTPKTRDFYHR
ncbi:phosphotransferase [Candidatus Woesearchaeota archaeon]|nr:phosphotransferase [Candidatus Woesearchaeota archaeon]